MKITNGEVVKFVNGVGELREKKLPIKIGFAITRNLKALESVALAYEEERVKILDKYAEKGEDGEYVTEGDSYKIDEMDAYAKELQELLDIENDVQFQRVKMEDLEKCDSEQFDSLSVQDISLLEIMTDME